DGVRIVGWTFRSVAVRVFVVVAVAVVFTVGFIVLVVVRDEVPQRETVVRGDEVHAGCGHAPTRFVQVTTAGETVSELTERAAVAAPEGPHRISIAAIPLCPPDRKLADLV